MNKIQKEEFDSLDEFEQIEIKRMIKFETFESAIISYVNGVEGDYSQLSASMLKLYKKYGNLKNNELKRVNIWIVKKGESDE